ncbi:RNA helicase aquarius-like [Oppia nitens]|uniref:RNA helicase aquarius-like n=1 Tax=Oppia nitens TaxID=1686743 RepID=UPI0023D9CD3F|nr:RNA helicase aquarius-like [Oppia nitens]
MPEIVVTNSELNDDYLIGLSRKYWSPATFGQWSPFDRQLVTDIYKNEIQLSSPSASSSSSSTTGVRGSADRGGGFNTRRIVILELSRYLENYLWPNFGQLVTADAAVGVEYLMSIVVMVNEKFRERVNVWQCFEMNPQFFGQLVSQVTRLMIAKETADNLSFKERTALLVFIIHCFNGIEVKIIRDEIQKYVSLSIWSNLSAKRREMEFKKVPKLRKYWSAIQKKDKQMDSETRERVLFERSFLCNLIKQFFGYLSLIPAAADNEIAKLDKRLYDCVHYCERFLELMIDLESILQTRRFFNAIFDDQHVVIRARMSNLAQRTGRESKLFGQLLEMLVFYADFEIDDMTGEAMTYQQIMKQHYDAIHRLQIQVFQHFPALRQVFLANVSAIDSRSTLAKHFQSLTDSDLLKLAELLGFGDEDVLRESYDKNLIKELIYKKHERKTSRLQSLNEMPLYPSEAIIWDENLVSSQYFSSDACLALPKLNLQFLTLHDYLLRNFHLFRLESTYEIRQDIEQAVSHMKPWRTENGGLMFGGWARMAIGIDSFTIIEVRKPNLGDKQPSRVRADIVVNLNVHKDVKHEWEMLRKHDVCFLITVRPRCPPGTAYKYKEPFIPQVGLTYVRGCEIEGMLDPHGKIVDETSLDKPFYNSDFRTFRVWLDCNQYKEDMDRTSGGSGDSGGDAEDIYDSFNILVRRKPKENNFKAVLETIRDLMNTECVVPEWLQEVLLGFGDPSAAHYSNMATKLSTIDFCDTFLDFDHLKESFSGYDIQTTNDSSAAKQLIPPFKVTFNDEDDDSDEEDGDDNEMKNKKTKSLIVVPYVLPNRGPYDMENGVNKKNTIRFTPTQVEAIKSGTQPGLTVIVGPPGTGKTDVAVQIISNIYHNFPDQRTLIVTHSNQALNALFEKIMSLDIDERHLLRLGHGEESLDTSKDFSRYGRVNYVLAKRLDLLGQVEQLAKSLNIQSDVGYTCETAGYFYLYNILSRWERYLSKLRTIDRTIRTPEVVAQLFPFHKFFATAPQPLFRGQSFDDDLELARGCYRHIKQIFTQLDEFKAFEMLRSGLDRSNYLLVREAKIIAMTCTHAALKRKELVQIGFQYDNILMEESAQILEIETFIPLLLQNSENGHNRLKRWIMIGDHHQLPPVIKNMTFQKFSNLEQSLFTRFVRLGVGTVDLDAQGRARPSLCSLYKWRYKRLGDLKHVLSLPEYQFGNPGFKYDYQLIDVDDYNGIGESEPVAHFYQNLAEAEYLVATFMYMRLMGYPADKITILTTYNGQKHLIRDVVKQRCATNPFIGFPSKITTVDKYQGQQNDYILLSLVRTKTVGHIRDVRRLVVALSRARLGLYIFARISLFRNCYELSDAFKLLTQRPDCLHLLPAENFTDCSRKLLETDSSETPEVKDNSGGGDKVVIKNMQQMVQFVYQYYQQKVEQWKQTDPQMLDRVLNKTNNKSQQQQESAADEVMTESLADDNEESGGNDNNDDNNNDKQEEEEMDDKEDDEEEEDLGFEKLTEDDTGTEDIVENMSITDD